MQAFLGGGKNKCCRQGGFAVSLGALCSWRDCVSAGESHSCSMANCREPKRGLSPVVGRTRTCAGKPQWISSPSPTPLGHNYLLQAP